MNKLIDSIIGVVNVCCILALICTLFLWFRGHTQTADDKVACDTIVYHDTIFVDRPVARDSIITKMKYVHLPVQYIHTTDTIHDTTIVEIPITQKRYETEDYRAYVSGYNPSLDSLYIYRHNSVIEKPTKSKRWSVGISAGYGITPKGFQPYIGASLNYRLWK